MSSLGKTFISVTLGDVFSGLGSNPWSGQSGGGSHSFPPPPLLPQLHDTGNIPRGEDPPDVVEVSNEDAAICSTGQC